MNTQANTQDFQGEIASGKRFEFGKNWQHFLAVLDEGRIVTAEQSLKQMLGVETLAGQTFLDIGCGSSLFSLAAMRLGADRVHSLDYDPQSAACADELKRRYFPNAANWTIERASVLDAEYMLGLGQWDIVYSWGVLHHTGDMWSALSNVAPLVKQQGRLFISIYNDQGSYSRRWKRVKTWYNKGIVARFLVSFTIISYWVIWDGLRDVVWLRDPTLRYRKYKNQRGMSRWHDWHDWLGGLPFEVAKPEDIFDFYRERGFLMERMKTCAGGIGCNEFVFVKL